MQTWPAQWTSIVKTTKCLQEAAKGNTPQDMPEEEGFMCEVCGVVRPTKKQLASHKWQEHGHKRYERKYIHGPDCPVCAKSYGTRLRCVEHHGPRGTHDILAIIPLIGGPGTQMDASSPVGLTYDLQGEQLSLRGFDLRLTDSMGKPVNLRGRPLAVQITFS